MARAVARQCQMDPKVYLPLLKTFEDLGQRGGRGVGVGGAGVGVGAGGRVVGVGVSPCRACKG